MQAHSRAAKVPQRWLPAIRVAWITVIALVLALFVAALPYYYQEMRTIYSPETPSSVGLTAEDAQLLRTFGLSVDFYAAFDTATTVIFALVFLAFGSLLFWRRFDDRLALFVSFWFAIFAVASNPLLDPLIKAHPVWHLPVRVLQGASMGGFPIFTYLFPDGRFVPHWTRGLTLAWMVWILISPFTPFVVADFAGPSSLWFGVLIPVSMGIGILAQVYRYRHVSSPLERQQLKWVLFGLITVAMGFALYALVTVVVPSVTEPSLLRVLSPTVGALVFLAIPFYLLPVFIGIAILRYRLWDIDVVLRRTLVYGVLSAILAVVYFGGIVVLQAGLRILVGQSDSPVAVVASTLATVALFTPLRRRVQDVLDRRFYRRKYNAEQVLEQFATTARDEVELSQLNDQLLTVVEDTMQPAHVSLWLKRTARDGT